MTQVTKTSPEAELARLDKSIGESEARIREYRAELARLDGAIGAVDDARKLAHRRGNISAMYAADEDRQKLGHQRARQADGLKAEGAWLRSLRRRRDGIIAHRGHEIGASGPAPENARESAKIAQEHVKNAHEHVKNAHEHAKNADESEKTRRGV